MSEDPRPGAAPASKPPPICVAFVWHMHQPYYRSATTGAFQMPWARLHAVKDYLDMVEILSTYPTIHQTFNLVPSLIEQLEDYAAGGLPEEWTANTLSETHPRPPAAVTDVYWQHTLKPAAELSPDERAFVVERMCERPDHPRARSHPRYLELAQKRESEACKGWSACAEAFTVDELRDLQVWFDLAWCDATLLETEPLVGLVNRGRNFREEDKRVLARVQNDVMRRVIPAYQEAMATGRIEVSTTPYYHPILPLLTNTDSARVGSGETILPHRRFAHPEDAWEHVETGIAKYQQVFGERPQGMWCSEQSVGEDVLPLLTRADLRWTISDQTLLARSVAGSAGLTNGDFETASPYRPYLLRRDEGEVAIVFRDHTLSDLIGFGYQSWDSRDAANDLLHRIRTIGAEFRANAAAGDPPPLVTIALDGENAWEYYPHDGRDFLQYLYDGLAADPDLHCVSVSEYLQEYPASAELDWLHTGSWIGGDLRTWIGDPGHSVAWGLLHDAHDLVAAHRPSPHAETAWRHIMVAEGSDWFWWFGEHHHTELDYVWDLEFRQHLQQAYRLLDQAIPVRLRLPVFAAAAATASALPTGIIQPTIDGRISAEDGWEKAGLLPPDHPSTMQRTDGARIVEARFGWGPGDLYLLLVPRDATDLQGLQLGLTVSFVDPADDSVFHLDLAEGGRVDATCSKRGRLGEGVTGAWQDVLEVALPFAPAPAGDERVALTVRVGRGGMTDHVFRSTGLTPLGDT